MLVQSDRTDVPLRISDKMTGSSKSGGAPMNEQQQHEHCTLACHLSNRRGNIATDIE